MEIKCPVLIIEKTEKKINQCLHIVQLYDLKAKTTIGLTELANTLKWSHRTSKHLKISIEFA